MRVLRNLSRSTLRGYRPIPDQRIEPGFIGRKIPLELLGQVGNFCRTNRLMGFLRAFHRPVPGGFAGHVRRVVLLQILAHRFTEWGREDTTESVRM
jgi:hypothetical protein